MRRWQSQYALNLKTASTTTSTLLTLSSLTGTICALGEAPSRLSKVFYVQIALGNLIYRRGTVVLQTQLDIGVLDETILILPAQQDQMSIFNRRHRRPQASPCA